MRESERGRVCERVREREMLQNKTQVQNVYTDCRAGAIRQVSSVGLGLLRHLTKSVSSYVTVPERIPLTKNIRVRRTFSRDGRRK